MSIIYKSIVCGHYHFGEGNDYPLQYSCLENCMERGAWWAMLESQRVTGDLVTQTHYRFRYHETA